MKYTKKILCLLLAGMMLLPLASCAKGDDPDDTKVVTTVGDANEGETEDPNFACGLPDNLNFQNTEVNIMCVNVDGRADELVSEKLGLGTISDAVYERNLAVENQLGVRLVMNRLTHDNDVESESQRLVQAGDKSVDIFTLASYKALVLALKGVYLDLYDVQYVDTSKHYWSQDYNNIGTFGEQNMQFLATSPAALSLFRLTYITIFHKDLFEEQKLESLYDVVTRGDWTLDYQYQISNNIYVDSDGDSKAGENDFYGFISGSYCSLDGYCAASNIHFSMRNENGERVYNAGVMEPMVEMADKVSKLFNAPGTYVYEGRDLDYIGKYHIIDKFAKEEGLMATTRFLDIERRIGSLADIPYGIVPMPKLSTDQENYRTFVQDQVTSFGISASIGSEDRQAVLGAVMESIAYNSNKIVRPAYYDTSMSERFMQDPRSLEMLDTMFEVLAFDYSYYIDQGGLRQGLRGCLATSNPSIVSKLKSWEKMAKIELRKEQKALEKMDQ